ncbi:MAG: GntR family transcriptional regulator [Planctomycetota bacterium]|nr:GntR family transcriptional regulator [Planctomycetota bacterium]
MNTAKSHLEHYGKLGNGRCSVKLVQTLKSWITSGEIRSGSFMPAERELSARYEVARMTVRRALKILEADGLLRAEPGKGYRVLARSNDPTRGCPIAFVLSGQEPGAGWRDFNLLLLQGIQQAAERRGWPVLGVGAAGQKPERIVEQCVSGRAWGLVAGVYEPEIIRLAGRAGLPVVMVDAWDPGLEVDVVFQNGFLGGTQAVEYLVAQGHSRIAWFGQVNMGVHSAARFGGAFTALRLHGLTLPAEFEIDFAGPDAAGRLRALLDRPDRPTAVLALWQPCLRQAADVARSLRLAIGRDIEQVGWSSVEQYDQAVAAHFRGERVPPVVEWSIADMAEMAVDRLAYRREHPEQPPVTINVQTRVRPAEEQPALG